MITTAGVAGWRVFFTDPSRRRPAFADPFAQRFAERLPELLGRHGRVAGQPFLLGLDGLPDRRVNGFFASHRMLARDRDTWRKYAYALVLWLNFLTSRGVGWEQAVPEDVEAFKWHRQRQLAEVVWRYGHGWIGRVGLRGLCQATVAVSVTSFQVVNRSAISRRYSSAPSRGWTCNGTRSHV